MNHYATSSISRFDQLRSLGLSVTEANETVRLLNMGAITREEYLLKLRILQLKRQNQGAKTGDFD